MISKVKQNPTDPLGILVGGIVQVLAAVGIFSRLELNADQIATVGSGLFMIAAAIRFMMTKESETPVAQASSRVEEPAEDEDEEREVPTPDAPEAAPAEASGDDKTPIVGPPPTI